jgi:hypothetical protein
MPFKSLNIGRIYGKEYIIEQEQVLRCEKCDLHRKLSEGKCVYHYCKGHPIQAHKGPEGE